MIGDLPDYPYRLPECNRKMARNFRRLPKPRFLEPEQPAALYRIVPISISNFKNVFRFSFLILRFLIHCNYWYLILVWLRLEYRIERVWMIYIFSCFFFVFFHFSFEQNWNTTSQIGYSKNISYLRVSSIKS